MKDLGISSDRALEGPILEGPILEGSKMPLNNEVYNRYNPNPKPKPNPKPMMRSMTNPGDRPYQSQWKNPQ